MRIVQYTYLWTSDFDEEEKDLVEKILDLAKQKDNMVDKFYHSVRPWTHGQEPGRVHGWRQIHMDQSKENNVKCQGKPKHSKDASRSFGGDSK